jgi:hypothetical protein
MKTRTDYPFSAAKLRTIPSLLCLLAAPLLLFAAAAPVPSPVVAPAPGGGIGQTGEIRGQVNNAATAANLESVHVKMVETSRDYYTARDGTFEIAGLNPGAYTLVFEYPGLDQKRARVVVTAGGSERLNIAMSSDVYVMPELVVAGQREGNAAAIVEQRYAANVKNVMTADAFGDITKANLGNILRRIPGVTGITDDEIDTSVIMVRGMEAYLTSIDIDGTRATGHLPARDDPQRAL